MKTLALKIRPFLSAFVDKFVEDDDRNKIHEKERADDGEEKQCILKIGKAPPFPQWSKIQVKDCPEPVHVLL